MRTAVPYIPPFRHGQQGGGRVPVADRKVFTAVVYVLTGKGAWRYLPPTFGTSPATAYHRFGAWTTAGLWRRLHRAVRTNPVPGVSWAGPQRSPTPRQSVRKGAR
ncbi:transposase [Streptomyces sp. NPDC047917]|uniref:transposase n=1 Tax=Streptomyces sp. NPDC047917 TaxID=3365491 RepID=UPI00371AC47C